MSTTSYVSASSSFGAGCSTRRSSLQMAAQSMVRSSRLQSVVCCVMFTCHWWRTGRPACGWLECEYIDYSFRVGDKDLKWWGGALRLCCAGNFSGDATGEFLHFIGRKSKRRFYLKWHNPVDLLARTLTSSCSHAFNLGMLPLRSTSA